MAILRPQLQPLFNPLLTHLIVSRTKSMLKLLYLLAMYSGARAAYNKALSFLYPVPKAVLLKGTTLQVGKSYLAKLHVDARCPPKISGCGIRAGMISVYLESPGISKLEYALLRTSSHFGYGHVEIAFYETQHMVHCFGVRNILRSNIERLGLSKTFTGLKLLSFNDEVVLLHHVMQKLNAAGHRAHLLPPEQCVRLSVTESLINANHREQTIDALIQKYSRITKRIQKLDSR